MSLKLVLPRKETIDQRSYPTTTTALRSFLATVPIDTHARLRRIDGALAHLAWTPMERNQRFDLLRLYRRDIKEMEAKLQSHLVGLSLPLSRQAHTLCHACRSVFLRLADVYIRILIGEEQADQPASQAATGDRARACYWALHYLAESLCASYEGYCQPMPRVWLTIHDLYKYARALKLDTTPIRISGGEDGTRTIEMAYKKVVLLGLSDPYQLPFRTARAVHDATERWSTRVQLRAERPRESPDCLFLVDFGLDRPGLPVLPRTKMPADRQYLFLDASKLVSHLNNKMDNIISQTLNHFDNEQTRFTRFEKLETLRSLIVSWGMHPVRQKQRTRTDKECDLVVGLNSICYVLNGNKPLREPRMVTPNRVSASMLKGTFGQQQTISHDTPKLSRNWELADESAQGIRLLLNDTEQTQVRIGELVAFRLCSEGTWCVGVVRWGQTNEDGALMIGVYKLGVAPRAVSVQHMTTDASRSAPQSLALMFMDDSHGVQSVVCDRGLYKPKMNIWIQDQNRQRIVETNNVIISTRCFIWFGVARAHANREETLDLICPREFA